MEGVKHEPTSKKYVHGDAKLRDSKMNRAMSSKYSGHGYKSTCCYVQGLANDIHKHGVHHPIAVGTRFRAIINEA